MQNFIVRRTSLYSATVLHIVAENATAAEAIAERYNPKGDWRACPMYNGHDA